MALGTRAMFANYAALQTTSNNIANSNTPGYSRQSVELATAGGQFTGAGFFGKGVDVATVTRAHSEFLTREAATTKSLAAADSTRSVQLGQLEQLFKTGEAGLGYAAGELLNAFVDVASHPQDSSARQVVLGRAQEVASRFRATGEQLDVLQAGVTQDMKTSVAAVNSLAKNLASLNQQIAAVKGSGHEPNDLLDQRDKVVNDLSAYLQVTTIGAEDGTLSVFIGGGQQLVLGSQATQLIAASDPYDPARVGLGWRDASGDHAFPDTLITGGSIAGLLRFQGQDLADARNRLGQMAAALSGRINEQQALGLDLRQPAGSGAPIFSVGAPQVLPAATNARDAAGNFAASVVNAGGVRVPTVSLTVANASELQASDYALRADPAGAPGAYQLTRLSDGLVRTVSTGSVLDGFRVDVVAPAPGPTDRFLLQPVAAATRNMLRVLDDPSGIAAAAPVTATLNPANVGTAGVASLRAVSTTLNPQNTATVSFTSDTGNYTWELRDRTTNALVSSGSATWTAGTPIQLNGWEMQLSGVPRTGDVLTVAKTDYPASNNGNARAIVDLRDAGLVGQQTLVGGVVVPGETITDAYASAMAEVGVRVQNTRSSAEMSESVAAEAEAARSDKAGVNLDEEAARLIQFQQSYQAAAKMLQVAQSVFDTLLQTVGR
jgi:flagellar hook-associated protein 1 FlgK